METEKNKFLKSEKAILALCLAAIKKDGNILVQKYASSFTFEAGPHLLYEGTLPREVAGWRQAIKELEEHELIQRTNTNPVVAKYTLTEKGFALSEKINNGIPLFN
jgi:hypothetical protein